MSSANLHLELLSLLSYVKNPQLSLQFRVHQIIVIDKLNLHDRFQFRFFNLEKALNYHVY